MKNEEKIVIRSDEEVQRLWEEFSMIEVTPEMLKNTTDEQLEEMRRQKAKLLKEREALEDVKDTELEIQGIETTEDRMAAALSILEKEKQLQDEREKEWKKEKRSKKIKRTFKLILLIAIMLILLFAWLSGYRIPVPDSWVARVQEIWNAAKDWVTSYFVAS